MGLFPISVAKRFLDTAGTEDIYASAKTLLSGLFSVMQAKTIYFKYGMHPMMRDLMARGLHDAGMRRLGAGGTVLYSSDDDDESTIGEHRVVGKSVDAAVETCATRLAKLSEIPRVSRGISFGIDVEATNPDTTWHIFLHRGPLPLLDTELSNAPGFHPPDGWQDAFLKSHCAHVVRSQGSGDNVVLSLKRRKLFSHSRGNSSAEAVGAGQQLRKVCREVWQKQAGERDTLAESSPWEWRRRRLVRKFDRALVDHAGSENLDAILKRMDTRLESWLAADS
jgi:hypothetical protein